MGIAALITAVLLEQNDGNLRLAARKAQDVIEATQEEQMRPAIEGDLVPQFFANNQLVAFAEAVPVITGLKDREQNTKIYREFLTNVIVPFWNKNESLVGDGLRGMRAIDAAKKLIRHQQKFGLPKFIVAAFAPLYEATKPKRRKTPRAKRKWRKLSWL